MNRMLPSTAVAIRNGFLRGEYSATEICSHFLNRIERWNPDLGAFLAIYRERALEQASHLDQRLREGGSFGKLAAIPVAVKDNIHLKGQITTCASKFLVNYRAPFDATVTKRIEEEDGIILGKCNLDEFAMGSSCEYSALGPCRNPWNLACTPGGSSGGSAAAVAAQLAPLSLGSETGGSIRHPASFCGIVGLKPTYGLVSRYGLVAFGSSLDQIGPFARTIRDLALLLEVISGQCNCDGTSLPNPPFPYLQELERAPLVDGRSLKIGVPFRQLKMLNGEERKLFEDSLSLFEKAGSEIRDIDLALLEHSIPTYYIVASAEASTNLARFDGIRYGERKGREDDLWSIYEESRHEGFGLEVKRRIAIGTYVLSAGHKKSFYIKAQALRLKLRATVDALLQNVDVIATPTTLTTAFKRGTILDPVEMYHQDLFTILANLIGYPAISLPAGFDGKGLPFGLQLMAGHLEELPLLRCGELFERLTEIKRTPVEPFLSEL